MTGACERREWERDREVFGLFFRRDVRMVVFACLRDGGRVEG